jgi:hypothetical protein
MPFSYFGGVSFSLRRISIRLPLEFGLSWHPGDRLVWQAIVPRQSCLQAAFQAAIEQTTYAVRRHFSDFVSCSIVQRSLRNSPRIGNGGLKGRPQARLPATQGSLDAPTAIRPTH